MPPQPVSFSPFIAEYMCDLETAFTSQGIYDFVLHSARDQQLGGWGLLSLVTTKGVPLGWALEACPAFYMWNIGSIFKWLSRHPLWIRLSYCSVRVCSQIVLNPPKPGKFHISLMNLCMTWGMLSGPSHTLLKLLLNGYSLVYVHSLSEPKKWMRSQEGSFAFFLAPVKFLTGLPFCLLLLLSQSYLYPLNYAIVSKHALRYELSQALCQIKSVTAATRLPYTTFHLYHYTDAEAEKFTFPMMTPWFILTDPQHRNSVL